MPYSIMIQNKAEEHLAWFEKNDRAAYKKCLDLIRAISQNPREGIGQPERVKYFKEETYSRRVNQEDRLIYVIYEKEKKVHISACKGHYE